MFDNFWYWFSAYNIIKWIDLKFMDIDMVISCIGLSLYKYLVLNSTGNCRNHIKKKK